MNFKLLKNLFVKKNDIDYDFENIEFIIGDCGSGKSNFATKQAIKYLSKGYPVYSITPIKGCRKIDMCDLMVYDLEKNAVIILDESATYGLASRGDSYKKSNKANIIEFFTMQRHYKVRKVIVISPSFQDVIPIVRARVQTISVCKTAPILSLLLILPNFILELFHFNPIKVTLIKYIAKSIVLPDDKMQASEPVESFYWLPLRRSYFINNLYYPFFDSYSAKELQKKDWEYF